MEIIVAREAAEEVGEEDEEEEEEHEAFALRKSKRLASSKAEVILPASPKRKKDMPELDKVPRKRRKF